MPKLGFTGASRRWILLAFQIAAIGAGVWFLADTARDNWHAIVSADVRIAWGPLALASLLTAATYAYVVSFWTFSLRWWGQRLAYWPALRIWFVTNLARFIPGMVWQLAGLAAMVRPYGVSSVAATAAVLLQQVVILATGLGLAVATAPAMLGPWGQGIPAGAGPALAAVGLAVVVLMLPKALPYANRLLARLTNGEGHWPAPSPGAFAAYVIGLGLLWLSYGVSFWLFARAVLPHGAPKLVPAATAFVASYVLGVIAVFAPAGLVVREAALVAALSPLVGGGRAFALAVGARIWLVAVELGTALCVLTLSRFTRPGGERDQRRAGDDPTF
jgi:hypothetical protein